VSGARILIVEDNPANRELMAYILTAYGHTVRVAEDGLGGVDLARRLLPDLILSDVQLPDIGGFEVVRRLHDDALTKNIPLVAVTAMAMVGDRERVLAAGFDGYLAKPIDPESFVEQIEAYLPAGLRASGPNRPLVAARFTILVVGNLELASSVLEPSGYGVVTAGRNHEGLTLARNSSCHLIVVDASLGEESGHSFLQAVRSDPSLHALPVIFLTSLPFGGRGLELGATRVLRRPIEPDLFLGEIASCLTEKGT